MRIRTQFRITLVVFSLMLVAIATSIVLTSQQASKVLAQERLANSIVQGASDLTYLTNDYAIYHGEQQLTQWQARYTSFSQDISNLNVDTPQQQILVKDIQENQERVKEVFDSTVSIIGTSQDQSSNASETLSLLQVSWSRMSVQTQTLITDSTNLARLLHNQLDRLNFTNFVLVLAAIGAFSAFLAVIYVQTFRRTLKSISDLQEGATAIGSGNLYFKFKEAKRDEIGEVSRAFNQMTTNLKNVTASKTDLEREIEERKKAEEALAKSEQRWATTLSSIGDAVIATDIAGNITFMNNIAEDLTGWSLTEASQKQLPEVFPIINEETRRRVQNPVTKVLEKGAVVGLANHSLLVRRDGREVPIDDSGSPIKDENGKVTGVVLVFHDITERKKAEEALRQSEERFSRAFQNSPFPVVIARIIDNQYVDVNESFLRLLEYSREEVIGHTSKELNLFPNYAEREEFVRLLLKQGSVRNQEIDMLTKTGKQLRVLFSVETVKLNDQPHMISSFIDITERKLLQKQIDEHTKNLEHLIETRTKQLKDAERLAAIGATAGMVGHDIRNPLQAITSDVFLLKDYLTSMPQMQMKTDVAESLEGIEKNVEYINKIVQDLQDFARPLTPTAKETDLKMLCSEVLINRAVPENVKASCNVAKGAEKVVADPALLKRILTNLVNNAVQAMPNGGELEIRGSRKAENIIITVRDTGEGIPDEVKPKLFTPLFTTKSKGQGFGLAVVKRMTEALGGTITFETKKGEGTKFIVMLPQRQR